MCALLIWSVLQVDAAVGVALFVDVVMACDGDLLRLVFGSDCSALCGTWSLDGLLFSADTPALSNCSEKHETELEEVKNTARAEAANDVTVLQRRQERPSTAEV